MADERPLYAAVMIKGTVKINRTVIDTLGKLRLRNINTCVVIPADGVHKGMLKRIAD